MPDDDQVVEVLIIVDNTAMLGPVTEIAHTIEQAILSQAQDCVIAGLLAMRALRRRWSAGGQVSALPPLQGSALHRRLGLAPPMLLPLVFLGVWVFLLGHGSSDGSPDPITAPIR